MKKAGFIIAAIVLTLALAIPVFAAGRNSGSFRNRSCSFAGADGDGYYGRFVDANGDGYCDSYGRFAGADGDGYCDSYGRFVDANGDGICDSCPNGGIAPRDGTGMRVGWGCQR